MATKKAAGVAKNLTDSQPKFLGTKLYDGEVAKPGSVIVRQRGTKIMAGAGVRVGKDHTLYAVRAGKVKFGTRRKVNYDGTTKRMPIVNVNE